MNTNELLALLVYAYDHQDWHLINRVIRELEEQCSHQLPSACASQAS